MHDDIRADLAGLVLALSTGVISGRVRPIGDQDQDRTERRREERNVVSLYFYWNNNTVLVFDNIPLQPLQNGFSSFSRIYSIYTIYIIQLQFLIELNLHAAFYLVLCLL